jgi:ABC-type uncharacterized transport system involved in gliding motility auxiliary subunit
MLNKIIGLFGWLGVALVLSAVVVRFLQPAWQQSYNALAVAGLVCTLLYILSQWREIGRAMSGRQAKLGAVSIGSVLAVVAIIAMVNYIASRQNARWDLTANRIFSLSDQTSRVLESLDAPIDVKVFGRSGDFERFRDRLTEYENAARDMTVEYVDVDREPALANQYQIQSYGTVVFEYEGRMERIVGDGEQELTNGLKKVVEGAEKKVYFVEGHGEKDPRSADQRIGYSAAKAALESDNFTVETFPLVQQGKVPDDASVVVVAGPKTDYLQPELDALSAYVASGGKLLVLLDPPDRADAPPLGGLVAFLNTWGIEAGRDIVVDASGIGQLAGIQSPVVPAVLTYPGHPITENFGLMTVFPVARSVSAVVGGVNGRLAQSFLETGPQSWAETDLETVFETGELREPDEGDTTGPIPIGAAVSAPATDASAAETAGGAPDGAEPGGEETATTEPTLASDTLTTDETAPEPETRVAAIGDSDFAANATLNAQGNRDLFLNTVNWLAKQENLIAIRPREPDDRRISLTADQQTRVFWLSVIIIPGLLLAAGATTWWRRR